MTTPLPGLRPDNSSSSRINGVRASPSILLTSGHPVSHRLSRLTHRQPVFAPRPATKG